MINDLPTILDSILGVDSEYRLIRVCTYIDLADDIEIIRFLVTIR